MKFDLQEMDTIISVLKDDVVRLLTPRQRVVLWLMANEGLTHKEIAWKLKISRQAVKNHMIAIYDKYCIARAQPFLAISEAANRGEIHIEREQKGRRHKLEGEH